jgi:hypothetical protein
VRISDHAVGMRRATSGDCDKFITAGAKPASWAVWLSEIVAAADVKQCDGQRILAQAHQQSNV